MDEAVDKFSIADFHKHVNNMDKPITQTNRVVVAKVKNILSDIGSSKDMLKEMFTK